MLEPRQFRALAGGLAQRRRKSREIAGADPYCQPDLAAGWGRAAIMAMVPSIRCLAAGVPGHCTRRSADQRNQEQATESKPTAPALAAATAGQELPVQS